MWAAAVVTIYVWLAGCAAAATPMAIDARRRRRGYLGATLDESAAVGHGRITIGRAGRLLAFTFYLLPPFHVCITYYSI